MWFVVRSLFPALIFAAAFRVARRAPGVGALVASLPLVFILGMMWL
jgi:hypothetical protein